MGKQIDIDSILDGKSWINAFDNNIWLLSTLKFYRNFSRYSFPGRLDASQRCHIIQLIDDILKSSKALKNTYLVRAENLKPYHKEFLEEHYIFIEGLQQAYTGEAFIIDKKADFIGVVNLHNHLQFHLIDHSQEFETMWNKVVKIEREVGRAVDYAFSDKFGFLTSDPEISGSAMKCGVLLHLPALLLDNPLESFLSEEENTLVDFVNFNKRNTSYIGDMVGLHSKATVGLKEEQILARLNKISIKLVLAEKSARNRLKKSPQRGLINKIYRALGVIKYSYQLEASEAFEILSLVKLGLDLNWLKGVEEKDLNNLIIGCRRGHMMQLFHGDLTSEDLLKKRAQIVNETLTDLKLNI